MDSEERRDLSACGKAAQVKWSPSVPGEQPSAWSTAASSRLTLFSSQAWKIAGDLADYAQSYWRAQIEDLERLANDQRRQFAEIGQLRLQRREAIDARLTAEAKLQEQRKKRREMKAQVELLKERMAEELQAKEELDKLKAMLADCGVEVESFVADMESAKAKVEEAEGRAEEAGLAADKARAEAEEAKTDAFKAKAALSQASHEVTRLSALNEASGTEAEKARAEADKLRTELKTMAERAAAAEKSATEVEAIHAENERLKAELHATSERAMAAETEADAIRTKIDLMQREIEKSPPVLELSTVPVNIGAETQPPSDSAPEASVAASDAEAANVRAITVGYRTSLEDVQKKYPNLDLSEFF